MEMYENHYLFIFYLVLIIFRGKKIVKLVVVFYKIVLYFFFFGLYYSIQAKENFTKTISEYCSQIIFRQYKEYYTNKTIKKLEFSLNNSFLIQ